jgi:NADH dehydrogenase
LELINPNKEEYFLDADLILFTAGMEQSQFVKNLNIAKDKFGRVAVKKSMQSKDYENVFALGDCCGIIDDEVPSTAQAAIQQANVVARNVNQAWLNASDKSQENSKLEEFSFLSLGEMLSLGDTNAAITSLGGYLTLNGPLAAIGRRLIYVARMPTTSQSLKALFTASSAVTGKFLSKLFGGGHNESVQGK